jgi:hypothetical protein
LGENHILNKIIEKAKHRVGKIDNVTRKPEQLRILQADVDHIHLLLARVSTETEKKYDQLLSGLARSGERWMRKSRTQQRGFRMRYRHCTTASCAGSCLRRLTNRKWQILEERGLPGETATDGA